jgi:hypothetical protein
VFTESDGRIVATELARGPWDPAAQHGGAPAALLVRAFEQLVDDDGLQFARLTFELLRAVPLGELEVTAKVVRPGRRVQLLEGSIRRPDGIEVVRARALRVHAINPRVPPTAPIAPPLGPEDGRENDQKPPFRPIFTLDAMELRFVDGSFGGRGPATAWFRMRVPIIDGEEPSPLQRLAAAADFPNGISAVLSFDEWLFINPDLTMYLDRPPRGEWFCVQAVTVISEGGIGTAEAVLYDEHGRVGRATQALLIAAR